MRFSLALIAILLVSTLFMSCAEVKPLGFITRVIIQSAYWFHYPSQTTSQDSL